MLCTGSLRQVSIILELFWYAIINSKLHLTLSVSCSSLIEGCLLCSDKHLRMHVHNLGVCFI